jgi:hypothetical protein
MRYEEVSEYVAMRVGEGDEVLGRIRKKSFELSKFGVHLLDSTSGRVLELLARISFPKRGRQSSEGYREKNRIGGS